MANDHADDLDELLDSALDDFKTLNVTPSAKSCSRSEGTSGKDEKDKGKEAGSSLPTGIQGLGMGLPSLRSKKKGKQKVATESPVAEALDKLREQTRETVKGFESMSKNPPTEDAMVEDLLKQFEELTGSKDMESIVDTMMHQLLSKDILHEPMKEIGARYPQWLKDHEATLSKEEFERYSHQYELIRELNEVYERDPGNFTKIMDIMQKMQECGQPPSDIVQEIDPGFDFASLGQLSPDMLESQTNCSVM